MTSTNVLPFPARAREDTSPSELLECNHTPRDNNYYYTRVRARAREDTNSDVKMVAEMYQDTMGRPLPRYTEQEVLQLMAAGIRADLICAVLAYTAGAPRPSWAYARAVLDKQAAMGARTASDFHQNVSSWRAARAAPPPKPTIQQQYDQRHYDPAEYDDIPQDQLEEMARR